MGRNKGRTLNPADQARKLQRQREKEKNAAKRKEVRTAILGKKELPELRDELRRLESSGTKLDTKQLSRKKMLQELISQAVQREADEKAKNQSEGSDSPSDLTNMFPNPEESIYWHPVLNPYGAPPPGMPQMYRPRMQPPLAPPMHPVAQPHSHSMLHHHERPHIPQQVAPGTPTCNLEPIPMPLENIPPPPALPELDLAFECDPDDWPAPPPRQTQPPRTAPPPAPSPEFVAVPKDIPETASDDTEEFGQGGLLLCDYDDDSTDIAPATAPATASASGQPAPPRLAGAPPSSTAKGEEISAAVTALVPASVRRRRQQPSAAPIAVKPAAAAHLTEVDNDQMDTEESPSASVASTTVTASGNAEGASADSFEAWMSDMGKLGVL